MLQALQLAVGEGPRGAAATVAAKGSQADQQWAQARAKVQRLFAMGQQLQGKAQTNTTYTGFREVVKMAQDALKAANVASRRARQERMASVGALPLTRLQLPGAPEMIEPSERLEADCQDQVQALAQEILRRGATAMAAGAASAGQGAQRPEKETGARASRGATRPGIYAPASDAHPYNGATSDHNGTAGLGRAAGAHCVNNGNEAGGSTAPGNKAAHRPVRGHEVQLEGGVQRWDEP
jgi:hypothetical protein